MKYNNGKNLCCLYKRQFNSVIWEDGRSRSCYECMKCNQENVSSEDEKAKERKKDGS